MKIDKKIVLSLKNTLVTILMCAVLLVIAVIVSNMTIDYKFVVAIIFISFVVVIKTGGRLLANVTTEHNAQFRAIKPLSWYGSIQDRAKLFLQLEVPDQLIGEKDSFANLCIIAYAESGEICLTEEDRAALSLTILETGISTQEPGDKGYYERERVALLENILAEKIIN